LIEIQHTYFVTVTH